MRLRAGQHLRRQSDIRAVRQNGARLDCGAFTIWWTAGPTSPAIRRACFVASTQAVGKAVLRNRAKRRMRELFRTTQSRLPGSIDMMFVARGRIIASPQAALKRSYSDACSRITGAS
jgi:ribonuclease P protein component